MLIKFGVSLEMDERQRKKVIYGMPSVNVSFIFLYKSHNQSFRPTILIMTVVSVVGGVGGGGIRGGCSKQLCLSYQKVGVIYVGDNVR